MIFFVIYYAVFQRLLGVDAPANKVQEVKPDNYEKSEIIQRDDGLVMYAPSSLYGPNDKKTVYEIVIHRPYSELNVSYR